MNLAVFVSGRGSNLKAVLDDEDLKKLVSVKAVVSNKSECAAFRIADEYGIPTYVIGKDPESISYENLVSELKLFGVELIVLAGFLKLIPSVLINEFRNKIINIHPALLPSFGGKGMYGLNVHRAVYESSVKVSGATVHFADEEYDKGNIIAQKCVDISKTGSPEEIAAKVLEAEHKLLPFVIKKIAEGKIVRENNRVIILD